jgi:AcrR family transcriptional regulator
MKQRTPKAGSPCIQRRIVQAAIRLHREIGFKKTTVADIAGGASMSPANVCRFFASRHAIEEAVVAELFEDVSTAATLGSRRLGSAASNRRIQGNLAAARTSSGKQQQTTQLVTEAVRENWAVALSYADRIRGLVRAIVAAGQASGELRPGCPMDMTSCLLEAMNGYLSPLRINAVTDRPTFDEMMDFCAGVLRGQTIDLARLVSQAEAQRASGIYG